MVENIANEGNIDLEYLRMMNQIKNKVEVAELPAMMTQDKKKILARGEGRSTTNIQRMPIMPGEQRVKSK